MLKSFGSLFVKCLAKEASKMNEPKIIVTMKDIKRYQTLKDVIEKRLTGIQASEILGLTNVHVSRLKKKVLGSGFDALLRKPPAVPPNTKVSNKQKESIITLRRERYYDFNVNHFKEKLNEKHNLPYCYTTVRGILVKEGLHTPKKKKIIHRLRRRMPKAGMLIQMDSSQHNWLPKIKEKWWLIAMIDDATNEVPYAYFFPNDTLFNNMRVIRNFIETKGLFTSLYVDKASHFKTTRHKGIHYTVNPEQEETQIERALSELGITLILANSPQAKGRIERLFGTFQDRLIAEMRLAHIKNYEQANKFLLKVFLPDYNARFSIQNVEAVYCPLPKDINLDTIFCFKTVRTVNSDNTFQVQGQIIQIRPSKSHRSFDNRKVDVCIFEDNSLLTLYNNKIICSIILSKNTKTYKKERRIETIINSKEYIPNRKTPYIPPPDHPWRKFRLKGSLTFQNVKSLTS